MKENAISKAVKLHDSAFARCNYISLYDGKKTFMKASDIKSFCLRIKLAKKSSDIVNLRTFLKKFCFSRAKI